MKRLFISGFLASLVLALVPVALDAGPLGPFQTVPYEPQPRPELYVFAYGGLHWIGDFEGRAQDGNPLVEFETENGWGGGGGLGLRSDWLGGTRFEVEGLYRSNEIDDILINGTSFSTDGDVDITGVAVNFIKELVWGRLYPYIGIGVGYAEMDSDVEFFGGRFDDGASSVIWQVIAGLDFPYTKRTSLFLEYRYMPVSDFDLQFDVLNVGSETLNFDDLSNHSLFAGIRFAF